MQQAEQKPKHAQDPAIGKATETNRRIAGQHRHFPSSEAVLTQAFGPKAEQLRQAHDITELAYQISSKRLQSAAPATDQRRISRHQKSNSQSSVNLNILKQELETQVRPPAPLTSAAEKTGRRKSHHRTLTAFNINGLKTIGSSNLAPFLQKSNFSQRNHTTQTNVVTSSGHIPRVSRKPTASNAVAMPSFASQAIQFINSLKQSRMLKRSEVIDKPELKSNTDNKAAVWRTNKPSVTNFAADFFKRFKSSKTVLPAADKINSKIHLDQRLLSKKPSKSRLAPTKPTASNPAISFACFRKVSKDSGTLSVFQNPVRLTATPGSKKQTISLYKEIFKPLELWGFKKGRVEPNSHSYQTEGIAVGGKLSESKPRGSEFKKKTTNDPTSVSITSGNQKSSEIKNLQVFEIYPATGDASEAESTSKALPAFSDIVKQRLSKAKQSRHSKNVHSLPQNNLNEMVRRLNLPISLSINQKQVSMTPDASMHQSPKANRRQKNSIPAHINEESQDNISASSNELVTEQSPIRSGYQSPSDVPIASPIKPASFQVSPKRSRINKNIFVQANSGIVFNNIAIAEPNLGSHTSSFQESDTNKKSHKAPASIPPSHNSQKSGPSSNGGNAQVPPSSNPVFRSPPTGIICSPIEGGERADDNFHLDDQNRKALIEKIKSYRALTGRTIETTLEFYHLSRRIGEGSYGKVYLGYSVLSGRPVAMKCYDKSKIRAKSTTDRILQEVDILNSLDHESVIKMLEIFENKKFIFMVLEYVDCGDLLSWMKNHGKFSEEQFLPILQQILESLAHIHGQGVLHRDIKLDNILLASDGRIKLCDFGISKRMPTKGLVFEHIGTPAYIAPEIVMEKGYAGFKADIWSLGITCYIALTGHIPFKGNDIGQLQSNILMNDLQFPKECRLSERMKSAILKMLDKNPKTRLGINEIAEVLDLKLNLQSELMQKTLDNQKIEIVKSFGFDEGQLLAGISSNSINHAVALYKML